MYKPYSFLHSILFVFFIVLLPSYSYANKLNIVATTGMIGDVVQNIGGNHVKVKNLMDSGVDPHLYRPTSSDMRALSQADIVFYNGYHLEGKMQDILKKMKRSRAIYAVAENIDATLIYNDEQVIDPHIWMDVSLWQKVAKYIYQTLSKHLPHATDELTINFQNYDKKLAKLHQQIQQKISSIPEKKRILITAHDAFAYFGRAYNMQVVALQGINTADEFGINDIIRMQNLIIKNNIRSIFLESSVPAKFMQSLQKGLLQKNVTVKIGGELFSDAMGTKGTIKGTYLGMMTHNYTIIYQGLK